MMRLAGRGVASGVGVGRALVAVRDARQVRYRLASSGVDRERHRLRQARERSRIELEEISSRISRTLGHAQAAIFAAQLLMLDDPLLARRVDELIRTERLNADWAIERAIGELQDAFGRRDDPWTRGRGGDLADVASRLQRNLRTARDPLIDLVQELEPPLVIVADELPASVAAQLDWSRIAGLVADVGSPTHHTVILLRSLGIPVVVGLGGGASLITPGQTVALHGATGEVVLDPADELVARWRADADAAAATVRALSDLRDEPARTADGVRITLEANLEIAEEVPRVRESGAEGIGLYRSEFLLGTAEGPSEDAQVGVYRGLLAAMRPHPVTVRTFDAAEDYGLAPRGARRERFGLRGARAALHHDARFQQQIRALLRSADAGTLRILVPFVTSGEEMRQLRGVIEEIRVRVAAPSVPVGAMIEVPAAALTVDQLARHADFLSVGTNDLIQYTLAVDRTNEGLGGDYAPTSPAVLRLLRAIAIAAKRAKCPVSVCGEMAGDPLLVGLLVGLGYRSFSMAPAALPVVKQALRGVDSQEAGRVARLAQRAASADEVDSLLAPMAAAVRAPRARTAGASG
jgi:phosphotransferase system enzyme I (PtsI)